MCLYNYMYTYIYIYIYVAQMLVLDLHQCYQAALHQRRRLQHLLHSDDSILVAVERLEGPIYIYIYIHIYIYMYTYV